MWPYCDRMHVYLHMHDTSLSVPAMLSLQHPQNGRNSLSSFAWTDFSCCPLFPPSPNNLPQNLHLNRLSLKWTVRLCRDNPPFRISLWQMSHLSISETRRNIGVFSDVVLVHDRMVSGHWSQREDELRFAKWINKKWFINSKRKCRDIPTT